MRVDHTGKVYGRLTAIRFHGPTKHGSSFWIFRCECGAEKIIDVQSVRSGATKSCGCFRAEALKAGRDQLHKDAVTHGKTGTREHHIWLQIRYRCNNKDNSGYADYGGRGIKVCERWNDFENFLADMGKKPSAKHSIDRIDNDGDYCPENCRWATMKEQGNNRRSNCPLTYNGETKTAKQWAEAIGMDHTTLWSRIFKQGWSVEKALTTPIDTRKSCRHHGVYPNTKQENQ